MSDDVWLVVGLGNPGPTYAGTRHNVGSMVIDLLATRVGAKLRSQRRLRADVAEVRLGPIPGSRAVLASPQSYMNESGSPVALLADFYKVPAERLLVIHDELDIPFGTMRLKCGGGDNGHNGLRSVRSRIGTGDYCRLRFGIGRPPGRADPAAFVLKPFSATEKRELELDLDRAADAVEAVVVDGLVYAQNHYNT